MTNKNIVINLVISLRLTESSVMLPTYIIFRPKAFYMPNLRPNTQKRVKLNKAFVNKKSI